MTSQIQEESTDNLTNQNYTTRSTGTNSNAVFAKVLHLQTTNYRRNVFLLPSACFFFLISFFSCDRRGSGDDAGVGMM
jgi:hypothetical protein